MTLFKLDSQADNKLIFEVINEDELFEIVRGVINKRNNYKIYQIKTLDESYTPLTARELVVLDAIKDGDDLEVVGNRLFISATTVKTHINVIFQKFQVHNRLQAVMFGLRHGLIEL